MKKILFLIFSTILLLIKPSVSFAQSDTGWVIDNFESQIIVNKDTTVEIKETIQRGAKFIQDGKIVSIYRHIKVIFKKIEEKVFVITVMIRKEQNGK